MFTYSASDLRDQVDAIPKADVTNIVAMLRRSPTRAVNLALTVAQINSLRDLGYRVRLGRVANIWNVSF